MEEFNHIVILITVSNVEEAQLLSKALLEQRLAACINIVPQIDSHFWWQNKINSGRESLLIVKTRASLLDILIKVVRKSHSYEVPEIIALPIIGGNQQYLDWIDRETRADEHI